MTQRGGVTNVRAASVSNTVSRLLARLREEPNFMEDYDEVLCDLEKLGGRLQAAVAQGVRFCLLIREGSAWSGYETGLRKGSF
jgi:hypothetical protein